MHACMRLARGGSVTTKATPDTPNHVSSQEAVSGPCMRGKSNRGPRRKHSTQEAVVHLSKAARQGKSSDSREVIETGEVRKEQFV